MMSMTSKRKYRVVQFIALPFVGIDEYVCVPYSWTLSINSSARKIVVTYPNNEDPNVTRDRVKRRKRPEDEWRFYTAVIKYESNDYEDAISWMTKNNCSPDQKQTLIKDTQSEPGKDRKLRSASQPDCLASYLDESQLKAKPYKNRRNPLPRISIKRYDKYLENKRFKLNEKFVTVTDNSIIVPGCSMQERSIIMKGKQNDKRKTISSSNDETHTEQSIDCFSRNESLAEQKPSPKLSVEQQPAPKILANQQISLVSQDPQPLSKRVTDLDRFDEDNESFQKDKPELVTKQRQSFVKTPSNNPVQALQHELTKKRLNLLVTHEYSLSQPHTRDVSVGQSKRGKRIQKAHLMPQILMAPTTELRHPSAANQPFQQYFYPQTPLLPFTLVSKTLNSELQTQEIDSRSSFEVAHNHQDSHVYMDNIPLASPYQPNLQKSSQFFNTNTRIQSPVVNNLRNHIYKKTVLDGISKNISTMPYPPNSMMRFSLAAGPAITQAAPPAHNHLQQAQVDGSLENELRRSMGDKFIDQTVPLTQDIMNTSATQNLSKLAHQYRSFVEASRKQQCLPTQCDYLQKIAIDQRAYHQNSLINGGFVVQNQPNFINQPIQCLSENEKEFRNTDREALPVDLTVKSAPAMQHFESQTLPSSDRSHETQSTQILSNHVYQQRRTTKNVVDKATETDSMMVVDYSVGEIAEQPVIEESRVVDSACQTDELLREEQELPYQDTASYFETATDYSVVDDEEVVSYSNQINGQNLTSENQHKRSKIDAEQEMLNVFGTLYTQMGANLAMTCDMFNSLRNSIIECAKTYETLLEKIHQFNSSETLQVPTFVTSNVTSDSDITGQR